MNNKIVDAYYKVIILNKLIANDVHYMHFLCAGNDFTTAHELTNMIVNDLSYEVDYITETLLEGFDEIPNFNNVMADIQQFNIDYEIEADTVYEYQTILDILIQKLTIYILALKDLRAAVEDESTKAAFDCYIRDWEKRVNYKFRHSKE